jgi:alpha-galactosidase
MSIVNQAEFKLADMTVVYPLDTKSRMIGLLIYPSALASHLAPRRETLSEGPEYAHLPGWSMPAYGLDPLIQVKWIGAEPTYGFGQGRTMRGSAATQTMQFQGQEVLHEGDQMTIVTTLRNGAGYVYEHRLSWQQGDAFLTVSGAFRNESAQPLTLELLTSFVLGGITPFAADDAPDRLVLHRFRASWSAEGRLDTQSLEQLGLERSWTGHGVRSERFGEVGSMPNNGFFPFVAAEDRQVGVAWGAQLAWTGSWEMEAYRRDDCLSLSGGLADREFGHWFKTLQPGEALDVPQATLSCVAGDLDELCHRLTSAQERAADKAPAVEADLPVIFNEWCTSWGRPTHENMVRLADRLKGSPIRYLVIDAGWYAPLGGEWATAQGDWIPNPTHYPQGLAATAQAMRERGLIPGLWFEMEVTGESAAAYQLTDHLLKRDGQVLSVGGRRFWDMNDPWVIDYLSQRVIGLLRETGMGYLKVDYNETLGMGVDGAESLGEALRRQVEGTYRFFERIHQELPELVIENCSSGGHRLEPAMMSRCAMGSFSDAHETREIPIIAANLQRLILPRQSQIWAVLRKTDDDRRLRYLLAATFLGRMCLSGDANDLNEQQWGLALEAQALYQRVVPIIKHGHSYRYGPVVTSYRHLRGWQVVLRNSMDGRQALVVAHSFGADVPRDAVVPLRGEGWQVKETFIAPGKAPALAGAALSIPFEGPYDASVIYLVKA